MRTGRTTFYFLANLLFAGSLLSCRTTKEEIKIAQTSAYQADFAIVYTETLAVVTELYPNLVENPSRGVIKTAWHPLRIRDTGGGTDPGDQAQTRQGLTNAGGAATGQQGLNQGTAGQNVGDDGRRYYFVRFNVAVIGRNPPFRVRVEGEASAWQTGRVPTPLRGPAIPAWLGPRIDTLRVKIHRRLQEHAIPLKVESEKEKKVEETIDTSNLDSLDKGSAKVLIEIRHKARSRDAAGIRAHLDDNMVWSLNEAPNADVALAMWQADPSYFDRLANLIGSSCVQSSNELVECTNQEESLMLALRDSRWMVLEFLTQ